MKALLTACTLLVATQTVWADALEIVTEIAEVKTVIDENGNEMQSVVDAGGVIPGDTVRYRIRIRNNGSEPADDIVIDNPVPEHTTYVPGSAAGQRTDILFSTDGGETFAKADAPIASSVAPAAGITHVRWALRDPLPAGAETFISFLVIVN